MRACQTDPVSDIYSRGTEGKDGKQEQILEWFELKEGMRRAWRGVGKCGQLGGARAKATVFEARSGFVRQM